MEKGNKKHNRFHRLVLLLLAGQGANNGAETKTVEQPVETQSTQQTVDDTAETQAAKQATHDAQDTREQQADSGNDLEERLAQETPERVKLLLGVRHVLELALGAIDALGDRAGELKKNIVSILCYKFMGVVRCKLTSLITSARWNSSGEASRVPDLCLALA